MAWSVLSPCLVSRDRKRVVVVGSSFTGLAAALELKRRLGSLHDVVVVSQSDELVFTPSLVWVPFGLRDKLAVSQLVRPELAAAGVVFKQAPITQLDLAQRRVTTALGSEPFDYLVIATGSVPDYDSVEGLGPRGGHTQSIVRWADATLARLAFERFLDTPGPVVIGGVQGASCLDLAYEFLLAMALQLGRRGLTERAPITFLSPEPFLGHLGRAGEETAVGLPSLLKSFGIEAIVDARLHRIEPGNIELEDGRRLPFGFAMLLPRRVGAAAIRRCPEITDGLGLVKVDPWGRTVAFPSVFAAGGAVALGARDACGPPTAGYVAEASARVVAANIAASIRGEPMVELPDLASDAGVPANDSHPSILDGSALRYREHRWLLPGPDARWAKQAYGQRFAPALGPAGLRRHSGSGSP